MSIGRQAQRSEATRAAIVEAARPLFSERGYAQTALENQPLWSIDVVGQAIGRCPDRT